MTFYIILAISSFMISLAGTRLTIYALRHRPLPIDSNKRSSGPLRGGGIAVLFAMVICLAVADIHYMLIFSMLVLSALSLLSAFVKIPPLVRLLVHVLAVVAGIAAFDMPTFGQALPLWLDRFITGVIWLWFINIFQGMDGIDGLSATETVCIGIGLCLIIVITSGTIAPLENPLFTYSLIVGAAGCGFLWWNWHPAKILMGTVGSLPLGFILGYLLLLAAASGYAYAALILPSYYLSDHIITNIRRLRKGKKIWTGHSDYYYQQAAKNGRHCDTIVRSIFGINILLFCMAASSVLEPDLALFHLSLGYMSVFMLLGYFAHSGPYAEKKR